MRTAYLLGAGFSADMGMPLVWDLTNQLTSWLTPAKLREANGYAAARGNPTPEDILALVDPILTDKGLHYEQIIGWLQSKYLDLAFDRTRQLHFYNLYGFIIHMCAAILMEGHRKNVEFILRSVPFYRGLRALALDGPEVDGPVWIFTLNHDICLEVLAAELAIPLSCGYSDRTIEFPRRDARGTEIGRIQFQVLTHDELAADRFHFLGEGDRGINLVKLHGSLDTFAYFDRMDYVRLKPPSNTGAAWLEALRQAHYELVFMRDGSMSGVTGEIAFENDAGEMDFLRHTILAGQYKFDRRIGSNAPPEVLDLFRRQLANVERLVSIGCSMGDAHINKILVEWMAGDDRRELRLVDPKPRVPDVLAPYDSRIQKTSTTATAYLDSVSGNKLSPPERDLYAARSAVKKLKETLPPAAFEAIRELLKRPLGQTEPPGSPSSPPAGTGG